MCRTPCAVMGTVKSCYNDREKRSFAFVPSRNTFVGGRPCLGVKRKWGSFWVAQLCRIPSHFVLVCHFLGIGSLKRKSCYNETRRVEDALGKAGLARF